MSLMSIKDLITSDPYYQNLVKPRGFPTGNDVYVPPTTPNPTPEPGIPSIVNPYLPPPYIPPNQGGGEGDGNVVNDYKDYGYTGLGSSNNQSEIGFNIDDIAEGTIDDDYNSPIGFNIDDIAEGTIDDEDMPKGLFEQLSNLNIQTPGKFALDLINKGITNVGDYFANRKEEKIEADRIAEETRKKAAEARQAIADAETIENIRQQYAAQNRDYGQGGASQETQDSYEGPDGSYGGQGEASDWGGGEKDGGYIDGSNRRKDYRYGGRVKYRDGGIASMFTRRR